MRAAVHVIPCAGVLRCARDYGNGDGRPGNTPHAGDGVAHAVLTTAERLDQAADVVLVAVPAGHGHAFAKRLLKP